MCNQDYGKDEDSSEALLKKHEALVSDLEAFGNTVSALKEQAAACRVSCLSLRFFLCVTGKLMSVWFTATRDASHRRDWEGVRHSSLRLPRKVPP